MFGKHPVPEEDTNEPIADYRRPSEPLPAPVKVVAWAFVFFLLYGAFTVLFGGSSGLRWLWFRGSESIVALLFLRAHVYVWPSAAITALVAFLLSFRWPIVVVNILGASDKEPKNLLRWYRPGSLRIDGDLARWREGRFEAQVNKAYLTHVRGLCYSLNTPVMRVLDPVRNVVRYETKALEISRLQATGERERLLSEQVATLQRMTARKGAESP